MEELGGMTLTDSWFNYMESARRKSKNKKSLVEGKVVLAVIQDVLKVVDQFHQGNKKFYFAILINNM